VHLIETGKVRPSMNSLRTITGRLAVPIEAVLAQPPVAQKSDHEVAELQALFAQQRYSDTLERGVEILKSADSPRVVALVHQCVGHALIYLGRPIEALCRLKLALELFESLADDLRAVETMELMAKALYLAEDPDALGMAMQALERCRTLDLRPPEIESRVLERIGSIHTGRGDHVAGRSYYEQALQAAGPVRDLAQVARIYHGLGFCYLKVGDLARAIDLVMKAETLYEAELRISDAPPNQNLPRVESDLGVLLMEQGDLERAEQRFQSALRRYAALGVERVRSHALLSLGELRHRQGRYDEGVELVEEAIKLAQRFFETRALGEGYTQLGELRAAQGDRDGAVEDFRRALAILEEAGLDEHRTECLRAYERVIAGRRQSQEAAGA
jgi:tetratricopeptide (TPR) repeat protein